MIIELINYWQLQNIKPLSWNQNLYNSAYQRAIYLESKNEFSHYNWIESIKLNYGTYSFAGENLARNQKSIDQVIEQWHNSESHKNVLQNENACEYGLAEYKNYTVLHVACKPKKWYNLLGILESFKRV